MSDLTRFSVSLEADLLESFDRYVRDGSFATRSEAIRQLLRQSLTRDTFEGDGGPVTATLTLVYDHHRPHLVEKLLELQHQQEGQVVASMHVHLDHDRCMEVIVLRGAGAELRKLAAALRGLKGVHAGELTLAGPAEMPAAGHAHRHGHSHPHTH
ncbi:MAG TPA: nickel-responsive transcriptional regulator NikR [Gemmata sp.]|nr:nickel-responsive transcriptional regulator NikR [Gemmata sp.]